MTTTSRKKSRHQKGRGRNIFSNRNKKYTLIRQNIYENNNSATDINVNNNNVKYPVRVDREDIKLLLQESPNHKIDIDDTFFQNIYVPTDEYSIKPNFTYYDTTYIYDKENINCTITKIDKNGIYVSVSNEHIFITLKHDDFIKIEPTNLFYNTEKIELFYQTSGNQRHSLIINSDIMDTFVMFYLTSKRGKYFNTKYQFLNDKKHPYDEVIDFSDGFISKIKTDPEEVDNMMKTIEINMDGIKVTYRNKNEKNYFKTNAVDYKSYGFHLIDDPLNNKPGYFIMYDQINYISPINNNNNNTIGFKLSCGKINVEFKMDINYKRDITRDGTLVTNTNTNIPYLKNLQIIFGYVMSLMMRYHNNHTPNMEKDRQSHQLLNYKIYFSRYVTLVDTKLLNIDTNELITSQSSQKGIQGTIPIKVLPYTGNKVTKCVDNFLLHNFINNAKKHVKTYSSFKFLKIEDNGTLEIDGLNFQMNINKMKCFLFLQNGKTVPDNIPRDKINGIAFITNWECINSDNCKKQTTHIIIFDGKKNVDKIRKIIGMYFTCFI